MPRASRNQHHAPRLASLVPGSLWLSIAGGEVAHELRLHGQREGWERLHLGLAVVRRRAVDGLADVFDGGLLRVDGGPEIDGDALHGVVPAHVPHLHRVVAALQRIGRAGNGNATDSNNRQQPIQAGCDGRMQGESRLCPGVGVHRQPRRRACRQRGQDADSVGIAGPRVFRAAFVEQASSTVGWDLLAGQCCEYPV